MKTSYQTKLTRYITNTATFSIGDVRYGWIPPQYFFRNTVDVIFHHYGSFHLFKAGLFSLFNLSFFSNIIYLANHCLSPQTPYKAVKNVVCLDTCLKRVYLSYLNLNKDLKILFTQGSNLWGWKPPQYFFRQSAFLPLRLEYCYDA